MPSTPGEYMFTDALDTEVTSCVGKHEQAAYILVTEERMLYQTLLSVSEVTIVVGSLWWHILGTSLAGPIV